MILRPVLLHTFSLGSGIGQCFDEMPILELSLLLNGAAARRVPLRCRELECITAVEVEHRLDQALSKARLTENERAIVILKRPSDDLRRRGSVFIREHDERRCGKRGNAVRDVRLRLAIPCADRGDLLAVLQE